MQVGHCLPRSVAGVGDDAEAVAQPLLGGNLGNDFKAVRYCGAVGLSNLGGAVGNVLLWYHKDVSRRLGIDVPEGEDALILVHLVGRDLSRRYLAKQAV